MALAAAEQYHRKTGKKNNANGKLCRIFLHADFCQVLLGSWGYPLFDRRLPHRIYTLDEIIALEQSPLPVNLAAEKNSQGNPPPPIPPHSSAPTTGGHILAGNCQALGLTGEVVIAPRLPLTDTETSFGRFSRRRQIAIMSGGRIGYKTLPTSAMQAIVNQLREKYDFVQIGEGRNKPLTSVKNMQGQLTLRQTAAVLANSDLFVGAIGGLMHLARAVECPAVIAYAGEPPELCYTPPR